MRFTFQAHDRRQKSIALARNRLDVNWVFCRIAQHLSQLVQCGLEVCVKVHERICRPKSLAQLFTSCNPACVLEQEYQELERLFLEFDLRTLLPNLSFRTSKETPN
jgi:hypothetical protein